MSDQPSLVPESVYWHKLHGVSALHWIDSPVFAD